MDPRHADLLADIAGMYYLQDKTQADIAKALGISRVKVYRLLKEAREAGVVEISVRRSHARDDRLERALCERFDLAEARVLETAGLETPDIWRSIGEVGADALEHRLIDGSTIAVYLGRSTHGVVQAVRPGLRRDVCVAQAVGSTLFATQGVDSAIVARELAVRLAGEAHYLPSPMFADTAEAALVLRRQPVVEQTLALARRADVALLGIGDLDPATSALAVAAGLSAEQLAAMREAGIVGDMGGQVFTLEGGLPAHELTGRVVGLSFEELRRIPVVVAVAFGAAKASAILGALRTGVIDLLCTDDTAAAAVLRAGGRDLRGFRKPRRTVYAVGIDVGGTKIAAGIVDREGSVVDCYQTRAHSEREPEVVIAAIEEAFRSLMRCGAVEERDVLGVGVGFPGTVNLSRGSILISSNLPAWDRVPLRRILAEGLGLPVTFDNDAHMCAVGEHRFGAGRGVRNMCYVCFSTGFGLGAIVDDRLVTGHTGSAGELSHVVIEPGGRPCTCGKRGCLMAYASGIAIARQVAERIAAGEQTTLSGMLPADGRRISGEQVAAAAMQGDRVAQEVLRGAGYIFGLGLAMLVQLFNPELIVVGGGLTHVGPLLMDEVSRGLAENVQPELRDTVRLAPSQLGEHIGIVGAAAEVFEAAEV